jgi:predicted acyltransferase
MSSDQAKNPSRDASLDAFRGLAVLLMVLANYLADKNVTPAWLRHAQDLGFTVIDQIAPLFVVAMALSFQVSMIRNRAEQGSRPVLGPALRRSFALIGIGAILSAGQSLALGEESLVDWGVLQALGAVGIVLALTASLRPVFRLAIAASALTMYQLAMPFSATLILGRSHGGLIGSVSWAAMGLMAGALLELVPRERNAKAAATACLVFGLGSILSGIAPVSKNRVSASYVLITLGISILSLVAIDLLYRRNRIRLGFLELWGKRPLALYLAQELLLAFFVLPPSRWWHAESPVWLVATQALILLGLLSALALLLDRKKLNLRL